MINKTTQLLVFIREKDIDIVSEKNQQPVISSTLKPELKPHKQGTTESTESNYNHPRSLSIDTRNFIKLLASSNQQT